MIEYNEQQQRMILKLVYYGPAQSGKTTNLMQLHETLTRNMRGDLMVLDTQDDRTIFFDLLPFFLVAPSGLKIKIKVYTVPGQVRHDATRKAVLQRADGVAFIADSQKREKQNNEISFANLEKNLSLVGLDIQTVPLVIQFNKRDLQNTIAKEEIIKLWKPTGISVGLASAITGKGVVETFQKLLELAYDQIDERYALSEKHGLPREDFIKQVIALNNF